MTEIPVFLAGFKGQESGGGGGPGKTGIQNRVSASLQSLCKLEKHSYVKMLDLHLSKNCYSILTLAQDCL